MVPSNRLRGFTIIELVVSMGILALLLVLFQAIFSSTQLQIADLLNTSRARDDASLVLGKIANELQQSNVGSPLRYDGLSVADFQPQLLINPPGLNDPSIRGGSIFFPLSATTAGNGPGLVGYFVRWLETSNGPRPRLCRMVLNSSETAALQTAIQDGAPRPWAGREVADANAPAVTDAGYRGWFADNILAIFIRPLDSRLAPLTFPARTITSDLPVLGVPAGVQFGPAIAIETPASYSAAQGYQIRAQPNLPASTQRWNFFGPVLPPALEIAVVSLEPRAMRRLESIPSPGPDYTFPTFWQDIETFVANLPTPVRSGARIHAKIIALPTAPR